jgi:hypothetical protein
VTPSCMPADLPAEEHALSRIDLVKLTSRAQNWKLLRGMNGALKHSYSRWEQGISRDSIGSCFFFAASLPLEFEKRTQMI